MATTTTITRELEEPPNSYPPLDPALLQPSPSEWDFLRATISQDEEEIRRRVLGIQKQTFAHYPYPCIFLFHFVRLLMASHPLYRSVVEEGKKGETLFLDLGCHMGTDARKLSLDGYPAQNIVACDLRGEFIDAGHELFRDRDSSGITFFPADILKVSPELANPPSTVPLGRVRSLELLKGRMTHIYSGSLFHIFNEETQYAVALRFAFLSSAKPGAIIFGRHQGAEKAGIIGSEMGIERYGHDPQTWTAMWKKAFAEVKGETFAESHVSVSATTGLVTLEDGLVQTWLFWSVHIV